jgi:uncharacterized integral membrane protein
MGKRQTKSLDEVKESRMIEEKKKTVLKKRKRSQRNKGNYSHVIAFRVFLLCCVVDVSTSFYTGRINWPCTINIFHYALIGLSVLQ